MSFFIENCEVFVKLFQKVEKFSTADRMSTYRVPTGTHIITNYLYESSKKIFFLCLHLLNKTVLCPRNTNLFRAGAHCPRISGRVKGEDWFLCTAGWSLQETQYRYKILFYAGSIHFKIAVSWSDTLG